MNEHVPNPVPWEDWTEEDHMKFRVFASHCPMCNYKYQYASLQQLFATAEQGDTSVKQTLIPLIQQKQAQLLQIGLFIATSVDDANKEAGSAVHN